MSQLLFFSLFFFPLISSFLNSNYQDESTYSISTFTHLPLESQQPTALSVLSDSDPHNDVALNSETVLVQINCIPKPDIPCDKIYNSGQRLKKNLQQIFDFKQAIRIKISMMKDNHSSIEDFIASAVPTYFIHLEDDPNLDPNFSYPPALAKQLSNRVIDNNEFDFEIVINPKGIKLLWFKDSNLEIGNKIDIDLELLHQAIHGLGFANSLRQPPALVREKGFWNSFLHFFGAFSSFSFIFSMAIPLFCNTTPKNILLTFPNTKQLSVDSPWIKIDGLQRPPIFDKYVFYKDLDGEIKPILSAWVKISSLCLKDISKSDYIFKLTESPVLEDAEKLYQAISKPNSLYLEFDSYRLPLEVTHPLGGMCPRSHVLSNSSGLLTSNVVIPSGVSLDVLLSKGSYKEVIGKPILDLLRKIGYHIKGESPPAKETFDEMIPVRCLP